MPHNKDHTWGQLAGDAWNWFNSDKSANLRNLIGSAGQLAATKSHIDRLQGLGDKAVTRIGLPETNFYDTLKADTKFTPFSVTTGTGGPGTVTTD